MDRMALYNQGLTDKEIAHQVGGTTTAIQQWRYYWGLTNNKTGKPKEYTRQRKSSHFREVLTPNEQEKMQLFLILFDRHKPQNVFGYLQHFHREAIL